MFLMDLCLVIVRERELGEEARERAKTPCVCNPGVASVW